MILDTKKRGVIFSTCLTPPLKKVVFKWGALGSGGGGDEATETGFAYAPVSGSGGGGGSGPKIHWGMCLLDKIMILQGVKPIIQPLGVGYANGPKQAQIGGVCGVFPYVRAWLALI